MKHCIAPDQTLFSLVHSYRLGKGSGSKTLLIWHNKDDRHESGLFFSFFQLAKWFHLADSSNLVHILTRYVEDIFKATKTFEV